MGIENYGATSGGNEGARQWNPAFERKMGHVPISRKLLTRQNLKAPEKREEYGLGFRLEEAFVDFLRESPGIDSVRLSSNYEDTHEGTDILIKFKHAPEEIRCQITSNEDKTEADVKRGVLFIKVNNDEALSLIKKKPSPELKKKIRELIIGHLEKSEKQVFKSLDQYYDN